MQNDKLLPCPFCDKKLKRFKGGYEHKPSQCVLSSFILTDVEIPKWNARKPIERIIKQLEEEKEKANERAMTENSIHGHTLDFESFYGQRMAYCQAIEIVKGGVDNAE